MIRIKMCGMTRLEDVTAAVAAGADAIGLVFWPGSPRAVSVETATCLAAAVPRPVSVVGVFVNESLERIRDVTYAVGLHAIQLHGDEPESIWDELPRPAMRSVGVGPGFDPTALALWPARVTPLLDVDDPGARGGTGRTIDWDVAAIVAGIRPVVLAGGLTADNVGLAVRRVRPAGVDVSSGIECAPGIKDASKMRAFVAAVRAADEVGR